VPAGDIPLGAGGGVRVDIRGKEVPVRTVRFPFVRDGKPQDGI
jgi:aminomethyltransferase